MLEKQAFLSKQKNYSNLISDDIISFRKKVKMKKELWQNEELISAIGTFIGSILIGAFFAYAGYLFCMDNEFNPLKGVVFGFLLPFIYGAVDQLIEKIKRRQMCWLVTAIIVLVLFSFSAYIPIWIGIIAMALLIYGEIFRIRVAYKEAKTEKTNVKQNLVRHYPQEEVKVWKTDSIEEPKEEIYCERCFKKISEEEYEGNDGMCEDCYEDVMLGNDDIFQR